MPIIYIAGPLFNHGKLTYEAAKQNWEKTIIIADRLMQKGWSPYVPHHSLFMWKYFKDHQDRDIPWEEWMSLDSSFIREARALYFIGHSTGADRELAWALDHGLAIYFNIDEVATVTPDKDLIENDS